VCLGLLDDLISIIIGFLKILLFYGDGVVSPMPQPPTWRRIEVISHSLYKTS
jgi:hypothetical protein